MKNTDRKTLNLASDWANRKHYSWSEGSKAAAEVIQSLPDEWVDAEKVRGLIMPYIGSETAGSALWYLAKDLEALLPPPPLPTLADMTPEERYECLLMQCETWANELAFLVDTDGSEGTAQVLSPKHGLLSRRLEDVIPRPDLPRMVWPENGTEEAEDTAADPDPLRPEDVPVGEAWQVETYGKMAIGHRNDPSDTWPWSVTYQAWPDNDYLNDSDVTLVARLVPEQKNV